MTELGYNPEVLDVNHFRKNSTKDNWKGSKYVSDHDLLYIMIVITSKNYRHYGKYPWKNIIYLDSISPFVHEKRRYTGLKLCTRALNLSSVLSLSAEAYSDPGQKARMELFSFYALTISTKSSILNVWQVQRKPLFSPQMRAYWAKNPLSWALSKAHGGSLQVFLMIAWKKTCFQM